MDKDSARAGVDLFITDRCGFNCQHCFLGDSLNAGHKMSLETVRSIARFVKEARYREVTLLGGEPFQHPDIINIVHEVQATGLECRIVTNGYRQAHKVLRSPLLPPDTEITFSVDGGQEDVHDKIRRTGSHSQLAETSKLAKAAGFSTSGIFSVSTQNIHQVSQTLSFCEEMGYSKLTVHHVTSRGNATQSSVLGESEWRTVLDVAINFATETGMQIRCEDPFFSLEPDAELKCAVQDQTNLMFFPDGRVFSCLLFIDSRNGNGARWDGTKVVREIPHQGEISACLETNTSTSCPAARQADQELYPASKGGRIRCIYDKVDLEHRRLPG